jgi:hypothetical protein
MRRTTVIITLLAVMLVWIAPVRAQDSFTSDEQAALDSVRAALESLTGAHTYTADITQKVDQNIGITYLGQALQMVQTMSSTGSLQFEDQPQNQYDNQSMTLTQNIVSSTSSATITNQTQTIGPLETRLIVVDDHIYLRMDVPANLQSAIPHGWVDVTGGADAFPGMDMFNIKGMLELGSIAGPEYADSLLKAVLAVDILEPETVDGRTANHYRLALDPKLALETVGAANLEQMFNADQSPFDVAGFIDLLFSDEDTHYDVDFLIFADDQTLHSVSVHMTIDVDIPSSLLTDPSLQGAEMSFKQDVVQITQISGIDVPVTIEVPELGN